jgi:tRNA G46 methylase TrmB
MVISIVFDRGNAFLNNPVNDLMSVQIDDRIIEIGFGTGRLIHRMAQQSEIMVPDVEFF